MIRKILAPLMIVLMLLMPLGSALSAEWSISSLRPTGDELKEYAEFLSEVGYDRNISASVASLLGEEGGPYSIDIREGFWVDMRTRYAADNDVFADKVYERFLVVPIRNSRGDIVDGVDIRRMKTLSEYQAEYAARGDKLTQSQIDSIAKMEGKLYDILGTSVNDHLLDIFSTEKNIQKMLDGLKIDSVDEVSISLYYPAMTIILIRSGENKYAIPYRVPRALDKDNLENGKLYKSEELDGYIYVATPNRSQGEEIKYGGVTAGPGIPGTEIEKVPGLWWPYAAGALALALVAMLFYARKNRRGKMAGTA